MGCGRRGRAAGAAGAFGRWRRGGGAGRRLRGGGRRERALGRRSGAPAPGGQPCRDGRPRPEFIAAGPSGCTLGKASGDAAAGGRTREFYEFVLPPVDIREDAAGLTVLADVPGFRMEDISVRVRGDLLTIRAEGGGGDGGDGRAVSLQRPRRLDKTVRLPVPAREEGRCTATCADGVLTVRIPRG